MADPAPVPGIDPDATIERIALDERSWVDLGRGWVRDADVLYRWLVEHVQWQSSRVYRYDHWRDEPRLGAGFSTRRPLPHPALTEIHRTLRARYGVEFDGLALAYYRNGRDGQAFHRDRDMRYLDDTIIALVTFGARRSWLLRPRSRPDRFLAEQGGATHDFAPRGGDLLVMGGACQLGWEHSVPQVPGLQTGRISAQFRWTSRTGRPVEGPSYRAPRHYSRG